MGGYPVASMARGSDRGMGRPLLDMISLLSKHRDLTWELAKRDLSDRHVGQWLGMFWVVAHPLFMMSVYVFVFVVILKIKLDVVPDLPGDYVVYLLAGLIPWLAFQDVMARSCGAVTGHAPLVKQVVFPVEVLPVKGMLASVIPQLIGTGMLLGYVLIRRRDVPLMYGLWPVLFLMQLVGMVGTSFLLSSVAVYFRDLKDFVQVFSLVGVYMMPGLYLQDWVPPSFQPLLYANPFSYMVWCYQDVFYFGSFQHPWAWPAWASFSVSIFYAGYLVFRHLKTSFGNVL